MPVPPVVIDTNVVISGLITSAPGAPTARILDGMLKGEFLFLFSRELLSEYGEVLLRPALQRLHSLREQDIDIILAELALNGANRTPQPSAERAPDPDYQHLWDLLASEPGAILITGDRLLFEESPSFALVLRPSDFAARIQV